MQNCSAKHCICSKTLKFTIAQQNIEKANNAAKHCICSATIAQ